MPGFSGQGKVSIAPRQANGLPGIFRDIGNASVCEGGLSEDTVERSESRSGSRLPFRRMTKGQAGTIKIVGDEFNRDNFALAVRGTKTDVAAAPAVTGFVLPSGVAVGDTLILPAKNVTGVAIKDSTGSPKVLALNTNYSLDPAAGSITILDLTAGGAFVQPLKADFTPGVKKVVGAFTAPNQEYWLRLDGVNTDNGNARSILDVFRVRISPAKALALISNDYLDFEYDGTILADLTRASNDPEGQFFVWTDLSA